MTTKVIKKRLNKPYPLTQLAGGILSLWSAVREEELQKEKLTSHKREEGVMKMPSPPRVVAVTSAFYV